MEFKPGVYTVMPTFFKEGEVDIDQLINAVNLQILAGIKNVVLLGTTSEIPTLTNDEQGKIVIRISINSSGKILSINSLTKRPINLAKDAKKILMEKKNLKKPPKILFNDSNKVIFEIPINYILR